MNNLSEAKDNFQLAIKYAGDKTFYIETILKKELAETERLQNEKLKKTNKTNK